MKRVLLCLAMSLIGFADSVAQTNLPLNTIVTENFDGIGTSATASLPPNWKMSSAGTGLTSGWTTATNVTATTQAANSGLPVTGGRYNWATTPGTDRAIGFLTTVPYADPNAIMSYYRNTTGGSVSSVTIAYELERYVINATVPPVELYYSTDGNAWTLVSAVTTTTDDFPSGPTAGSFATPKTINKITTINVSLANNADIYFRWVFTTSNATAQGLGLDNVSVFVNINSNGHEIKVYPNPATQQNLNLQFTNIERGQYEAILYNGSGQIVYRKYINHDGGSVGRTVNLPANIAKGIYSMMIRSSSHVFTEKLIIQ